MVSPHGFVTSQKNGVSTLGLQRVLGLGRLGGGLDVTCRISKIVYMRELPHIGNLSVSDDVQPGDWVVAGVCDRSAYAICSLVPQGFHTYARLFHPAYRWSAEREEEASRAEVRWADVARAEADKLLDLPQPLSQLFDDKRTDKCTALLVAHRDPTAALNDLSEVAVEKNTEVRWADVASANKRHAHPAMEWASITGEWRFLYDGRQPGLWDEAPSRGSLPSRQAARLAEMLAAFTSTPENCWFAVWEGYAALGVSSDGMPRVELPDRRMLLLSGPIFAVTTSLAPPFDQRANVWWPEDHSWCVATDIDLMTTYIGGSKGCIEALMADGALEVMPVRPDQQVTWDSDKINPLPLGHPGS